MVDNPCFTLQESSPLPQQRLGSKRGRRCCCGHCVYCQLWMHREELANGNLREVSADARHSWPGRCWPPTSNFKVRVATTRGDLVVAVSGCPQLPALITYHDLGLNYSTLLPFFYEPCMKGVVKNFCVYHICAPGQEDDAPDLPPDYVYPTMDELAAQVDTVCRELYIKSFVGFGVGLGANVLMRYALANPDMVDALIVLNGTAGAMSWTDWPQYLVLARTLRNQGLTPLVVDHLLRHRFGCGVEQRSPGLAAFYRDYINKHVNPRNLLRLLETWTRRSALPIGRTGTTLTMPVLNAVGALSLHVDDTVILNGKLSPTLTSWIKDSGSVIDERPGKIAEAFRLFVQGEGFGKLISQHCSFANFNCLGSSSSAENGYYIFRV